MSPTPKLSFFATQERLFAWFEKNHAKGGELFLGYYKRGTGKPSVTWPESVDAALCFGWIDGVRKSVDDEIYFIRFTPRKPKSIWSRINIGRVQALIKEDRMREPGLRAFEGATDKRTAIYAYEQRKAAELPAESLALFVKNAKAWAHFEAQAPWYRRAASHWVVSAKREETRAKRLRSLIEASEAGEPIGPLRRPAGSGRK